MANGGVVKAINAKGGVHNLSRRDIDALTKYVSIYGAIGLAYFSISDEHEVKSPLLKFLSEEEVKAIFDRVGAEPGDIIFSVADTFKTTCDALGHLRLELKLVVLQQALRQLQDQSPHFLKDGTLNHNLLGLNIYNLCFFAL